MVFRCLTFQKTGSVPPIRPVAACWKNVSDCSCTAFVFQIRSPNAFFCNRLKLFKVQTVLAFTCNPLEVSHCPLFLVVIIGSPPRSRKSIRNLKLCSFFPASHSLGSRSHLRSSFYFLLHVACTTSLVPMCSPTPLWNAWKHGQTWNQLRISSPS